MIGIEIPVQLFGGPKDGARTVTQVPLEVFVKFKGQPPSVLIVAEAGTETSYTYRLRDGGPKIIDGQPVSSYDYVKKIEGGLHGEPEAGSKSDPPVV